METESHLFGIICFPGISDPLFWKSALNIVWIFISFLILAFLSASELAIFAVSGNYKDKFEKQIPKDERFVKSLLNNPDLLRTTFGFFSTLLKTIMIVLILSELNRNKPDISQNAGIVAILIISIVLLYIIFIEIIPKTIANQKPDKFAIIVSPYIWVIHILSKPFSFIFLAITNWISQKTVKSGHILVGEISNTIEYSGEGLNEEEDIVKGIVKFANIDVSQILKPRVDVVAVEYSTTLTELLKTVIDSGYSRIPVYSGNFDNVKGILFVKDLMPFINEKASFRWQNLIRKPYFVPESKKVKELLTEFQSNKIHMAVIVDEYGGTLGIVTLEDILEEIVGEIADEADEDEKFFTKINDNTFIFDAKILLNDFYKIFHSEPGIFDQVKGDADTLAGLILELKGEIPEINEEITFKNFVFKIEAVDARRIKQIKVTVNSAENNE